VKLRILPVLILGLLAQPVVADDPLQYRAWLEEMREQPRGPFSRVLWYCRDGTVLPPKAYACRPHGGGFQHGEWSARTRELRERGYRVATLLAGSDPQALLAAPDFEDFLGQLLIEKFLVAVDDGWILRRAMFYRGAIQDEDERYAGRELLLAMLGDGAWAGPHFSATRTGVRMLPHGQQTASVARIRQLSAALSDTDRDFMPVRIKIHASPDAGDADRVRDYAAGVDDTGLAARYGELVDEIDRVYKAEPLGSALAALADQPWLPTASAGATAEASARWNSAEALQRFVDSARLLALMRDDLAMVAAPEQRLALLDFSLRLETENFRAAADLRPLLPSMTRETLLELLASSAEAAYGTGVLNSRLHGAVRDEIAALVGGRPRVKAYRQSLSYLGRAPGWGQQALRRYFSLPMEKLGEIEPLAPLFVQDQLRGGPLMFYAEVLNRLARDAGRLAGIRHRLFDQDVGTGFTALNPGLARGRLLVETMDSDLAELATDGIYLLPETVSELPPVAGILTAGEGNPLSHVQLLARNLGIPNVAVAPQLQPLLAEHHGRGVVLAVSPGGLVEIAADTQRWDPVFDEQARIAGGPRIVPVLEKLDLQVDAILSLSALGAEDSGRSVGPKAAKLGELRRHYPAAVSRGVALPFGLFKRIALDQPHRSGGTLFEWMQSEYGRLAGLPPGSDEAVAQTEAFRAEVHEAILGIELPARFRRDLADALDRELGGEVAGFFVRSDTNVEDLPGFTGAGLNLTLPNVIGVDALLEAIPRVWASPFSRRAFAWRQSQMSQPEHVYTSVLLLESVDSDKSGVLVTADIDSGESGVLSVAVNEGLGGAVDGQAAESLRIDVAEGTVRVLATASAPLQRHLDPAGGIREQPSSGRDEVLTPGEIDQLRQFARTLPERFPSIVDDEGEPAPADVEFGFADGRLRLFQVRPFLDSGAAKASGYLQYMDKQSSRRVRKRVELDGVPEI
jgi:hypothetical protein